MKNYFISHKYPVIRITVLFFFFLCAVTTIQAQNINLVRDNALITDVFEEIEKQAQMTIGYSESVINPNSRISVNIVNKPLNKAMEDVLKGTNTTFHIEGRQIFIVAGEQAPGQNVSRSVSGTVFDERKDPVIGANIIEKGTTNGVVTDIDGKFSLSVLPGATLEIRYIGYVAQNIRVGNRSTLDVVLKEDTRALDEVVVIGYSVQKKKLVTGATIQIKGDEMQKLSTSNPVSAMQSMSPGIAITQQNGMPGSGYKIYIRGIGTINNSSPLVIIDGAIGGDLNSLNPSDIESIDVLKDAASSAIYGARAANGVILVTTKQGKAGKVRISYDGYYGIQNVQKMLHTTDAQTYVSLLNETLAYDNLPPYDYAASVPNWDDIQSGRFQGTNWPELFREKNAPTQNHSFNISGGTEQSVYSIGFSYTSQESVFGAPKNPEYDRYTARINSDYVLYKKDNLDIVKFGENILFNYQVRNGEYGMTGRHNSNYFSTMLAAPPFLPVKDAEGNYSRATSWTTQYYPNPIGYYDNNTGEQTRNSTSLRANAYLLIQPVKDLVFKTAYTYDFNHNDQRTFYPAYDLGGNMQRTEEEVTQEQGYSTGYIWENTLNYKLSLNDKSHNFDLLLGQSIQEEGFGSGLRGNNVNPILSGLDYAYLNNTKQIVVGRTGLSGWPNTRHQIASFFGRLNYDYKETYLASVIMRADGSSNFARGNRWGYFPSVSAGWVITNESFMESARPWLDFIKFRASYGQNGNESVNNFQYLSTVYFGSDYWFGGEKNVRQTGAYFDILPNKDISWETSEQIDLGFDSRFLDSRLGVIFDYYVKNTKDWLVQAPALKSNGTGTPYINGGDIRNSGVEFAVSWNDKAGDLMYGINANCSYNKNEVTRIANSEGIIYGSSNDFGVNFGDVYRAEVGYPIAYFLGYKSAGVFQNQQEIDNYDGPKLSNVKPGDMIWVDTNGDKVLDSKDRTMIGNPHPKYRFGLNVNLAYKGFDFLVSGYGVAGNEILQNHRSWNDLPLSNFTTNIIDRRWHGEGTSNTVPRLSAAGHTNWAWVSSQYLEDGAFFRIDNVTIGYDFKSLFKSLPFEQLRLYLTAQNLYTITGYTGMDPEIGNAGSSWGMGIDYAQIPRPRTFMVGVNIKL